LRNFAFNRDGNNLKNQYKIELAEEDQLYVDIIKDSDIIDEELNMAGIKDSVLENIRLDNDLKAIADSIIENED
jgi:hypothetical protein